MHHCNRGIFALGAMYAYKEESLYGRAGSSGVTIRSFRPLTTLAPNQWMAGTIWLKARFTKALMGGPEATNQYLTLAKMLYRLPF